MVKKVEKVVRIKSGAVFIQTPDKEEDFNDSFCVTVWHDRSFCSGHGTVRCDCDIHLVLSSGEDRSFAVFITTDQARKVIDALHKAIEVINGP